MWDLQRTYPAADRTNRCYTVKNCSYALHETTPPQHMSGDTPTPHIDSEDDSEKEKERCSSNTVTTTSGHGVVVNIAEKTFTDLPEQKGFVTFMAFNELIEMCHKLGLPVCEAVIVTGKAGNELFNLLQDSRDFMTDELYNKILVETAQKHPSLIHIIEGNTTHVEVLGNVLEVLNPRAREPWRDAPLP